VKRWWVKPVAAVCFVGSVLACQTAPQAAAATVSTAPSSVATSSPSRAAGASISPGPPVGLAATADGQGFWVASANGVITPEGDAPAYGDAATQPLNQPIVGIAATRDAKGYWLVASDGGLFSFGDAGFYGSTGSIRLTQPIVGMADDPQTGGYWFVAADGGVFSFHAPFYGSEGAKPLNQPIVGMAATPDGKGYWLVASDGGVFSFGDARFHGSTGGQKLNEPIVGMAATPDGEGYWLVASDGGVFTFGDAPFVGSPAGQTLPAPAAGLLDTDGTKGYWVGLGNGQVQAFGGAHPLTTTPIVDNSACLSNPAGRKLLLVSITDQEMWACDGTTLASSTAVTTGAYALPNVYDATPTGTWRIIYKTTDVHLTGCNADGCWDDFVNYWMPFDGPYGFHDAPWQTFPFGSPLYATQGSHGCVHLPEAEAAWVYSWAPVGTTVTVLP